MFRAFTDMLTVLGLIALSAYLSLTLLVYFFQARYVYQPSRDFFATPENAGLAFEGVFLQAQDGVKLHGWFVPAPNPRATLLFCHGNAGNISHRLDSLRIFHELGLNVLIFDYRGYGHSHGTPDEQGTYDDARAAWDYLVKARALPPEQIIVFGRSLGGAVAAWLATQVTPGALVLESTFTSARDMAAYLFPYMPVRWLLHYRYATLELIAQVRAPIFFIHSPQDELVPYIQARALLDAAPGPKYFLQIEGGHNTGFLESRPVYMQGWQTFLEKVLGV